MGELQTIASWWMWGGFGIFVLLMLAVDMFLLDRNGAQKVSAKEALIWSFVWFAMAMLFGGALWGWLDHTAGREVADTKVMEYLTGYLLEKTLAMDNIFVFVMIFLRDTHMLFNPLQQRIVSQVRFMVGKNKHLDARH